MSAPDCTRFEAVIVPHRSLGPSGLRWVVGILLGLSAMISAGLFYVGAWPVIGFTGFEAFLAVWLIHRNSRSALAVEMLLLSDDGLRVIRTDASGRRSERQLGSYWLQATLEKRPGRAPALMLRDRGMRVEVGAALGEAEKAQLAAALREAIDRQRNPVFANEQLRDER